MASVLGDPYRAAVLRSLNEAGRGVDWEPCVSPAEAAPTPAPALEPTMMELPTLELPVGAGEEPPPAWHRALAAPFPTPWGAPAPSAVVVTGDGAAQREQTEALHENTRAQRELAEALRAFTAATPQPQPHAKATPPRPQRDDGNAEKQRLIVATLRALAGCPPKPPTQGAVAAALDWDVRTVRRVLGPTGLSWRGYVARVLADPGPRKGWQKRRVSETVRFCPSHAARPRSKLGHQTC